VQGFFSRFGEHELYAIGEPRLPAKQEIRRERMQDSLFTVRREQSA
jgi:hypothetical protein